MLPCGCVGVLIVAFGCVCGSVNNSTALGKPASESKTWKNHRHQNIDVCNLKSSSAMKHTE